jgi:hypothetical protein
MSEGKYIYLFEEGDAQMRSLLGGKGANLAEMTRIGLPVPPGFTISTEACNEYLAAGGDFPAGMLEQVFSALSQLEAKTGKIFGDKSNPLLVSVRSGAAVSMPGMMDTDLGELVIYPQHINLPGSPSPTHGSICTDHRSCHFQAFYPLHQFTGFIGLKFIVFIMSLYGNNIGSQAFKLFHYI